MTVLSLKESLCSLQVMDRNVHITNVCPGPVRTPMAENALLSDGSTSKKKNPLIEGGMRVQRSAQYYTHIFPMSSATVHLV